MIRQSEPNSNTYERERIILEIIQKYPEKHHNAILKEIVPKFMAKTTFEKTRDSLLEKGIIDVRKQRNMKFYLPVQKFEENLLHKIEQKTNSSFHDLKLQIKRLSTDYPHKDMDEKIILGNSILKNLILTDSGFTFLDSFKNPKKTLYRDEHLTIQQLIFHVFEIIKKDKDFEIIFPAISSNVGF